MSTPLIYPPNINQDTFMMFSPSSPAHIQESAPSQDGTGTKVENKTIEPKNDNPVIYLYHPEMVNSNSQLEWDSSDTGQIGEMASKIHGELTKSSIEAVFKRTTGNDLKEVAQDVLLGGKVQDIVNKRSGRLKNPRKAMFFRGVGFREHAFTFMFAPESRKEAQTARDIIVTFKKYSHPGYSKGGYSLVYPPLWYIQHRIKGREMFKYKPAYITAVNADFSPNQVMASFDDGMPVNIKLEVSFKEAEIVTSGDFNIGTNFGY